MHTTWIEWEKSKEKFKEINLQIGKKKSKNWNRDLVCFNINYWQFFVWKQLRSEKRITSIKQWDRLNHTIKHPTATVAKVKWVNNTHQKKNKSRLNYVKCGSIEKYIECCIIDWYWNDTYRLTDGKCEFRQA